MSDSRSPSTTKSTRVAAYIDGFNIYYGLRQASRDADRLHLEYGGDPKDCVGRSLYWLDLEAVVRSKLEGPEACSTIKYFSAPRRIPKRARGEERVEYAQSNERQRVYLEALRAGKLIEVILGWYAEGRPHRCEACGHTWPKFEEKVTDVNIATHLLGDAYENRFDTAFILSADADLTPPVEAVRRLGKAVVVGLFPGRRLADNLRMAVSEVREISFESIRKRQLADPLAREGLPALRRPSSWSAPGRWVWSGPPPAGLG